MKPHLLPVLLLSALLPFVASSAMVYRWVDAQGQVHYTQTRPSTGLVEEVKPSPPPTVRPAVPSATQPPAPVAPPVDEAADASKAKAERVAMLKRCSDAKERVSFLQEKTARRLNVTGKNGEQGRMSEEEFNKHLTDAQAEVSKYCK